MCISQSQLGLPMHKSKEDGILTALCIGVLSKWICRESVSEGKGDKSRPQWCDKNKTKSRPQWCDKKTPTMVCQTQQTTNKKQKTPRITPIQHAHVCKGVSFSVVGKQSVALNGATKTKQKATQSLLPLPRHLTQ